MSGVGLRVCVRRGALGPRRVAMRTSLLEELLDAVGAEGARHVGLVAHDKVAQPLHFHVEHGGGAARERVTRVAVADAGRRVPLRRRAGDRRGRLAPRGHLASTREPFLVGARRRRGGRGCLDRLDLLVAEGVPEREDELVELRPRGRGRASAAPSGAPAGGRRRRCRGRSTRVPGEGVMIWGCEWRCEGGGMGAGGGSARESPRPSRGWCARAACGIGEHRVLERRELVVVEGHLEAVVMAV